MTRLIAKASVAGMLAVVATLAVASFAPAAFRGRNGKIAYVPFIQQQNQIFTMRANGSHKRRVARNAGSPSFSADGRRIVYSHTRHGHKPDIYVMHANGSHKRRLTDAAASENSPAFSPSGRRIVFTVSGTRGNAYTRDLYKIRSNGTHRKRLTTSATGCLAGDAQFAPNGRRIVFGCGCDIAVMRPNGSGQRTLLAGRPQDDICYGGPDFSPDGRKIVFDEESGIYTMNSDGGHIRGVGSWPGRPQDPAYSPNGRKITFSNYSNIFVVTRDGTHLTRLTHERTSALSPSWGVRP